MPINTSRVENLTSQFCGIISTTLLVTRPLGCWNIDPVKYMYREAVKWSQAAADQGQVTAQYLLGEA